VLPICSICLAELRPTERQAHGNPVRPLPAVATVVLFAPPPRAGIARSHTAAV
jgi:hypothetical protein